MTDYPDVHALGKQLSDIWDEAFSGQGGTETDLPFSAMASASVFGSAAHDACPIDDMKPVAMMEAFLRALADPSDPRLDHLRACNQPDFDPADYPDTTSQAAAE